MSINLLNASPTLVRTPRSSYRLQLRNGFGFGNAASLVSHLSALGITECYLSPVFTARPGSPHGYDVCDPNHLDPTLGSASDFRALLAALRSFDIGLILDIVPNHMAADARANPWWRDVLRSGRASRFAHYFDIDWQPPTLALRDKVLVPILEKSYGEVLRDGLLTVADGDEGLVLRYREHELPVVTSDGATADDLNGVAGDPASFDHLHRVLESQAYRLASWRTAADEINYRRFFNVNSLIGVRVELPDVFIATHHLVRELVQSGAVTGLRVDHPDGLALPGDYFARLAALLGTAVRSLSSPSMATNDTPPILVVIEKVLTGEESLLPEWPVHGTTGYEFLRSLNGLFVAPSGTARLARVYTRFVGRHRAFAAIAADAKRDVMASSFGSDLDTLAGWLHRMAGTSRRTRDLTVRSLRLALTEIIVHLSVYRTYVTGNGPGESDRLHMTAAAAAAVQSTPGIDPNTVDFASDVVLNARDDCPDRLRVALRFQQLTAAVFAKAVEDEAFYRDNTLVSANEVGGDPAHAGTAAGAFHRMNERRWRATPLALSATATHDTKLGEDARARVNVLSERVGSWMRHVKTWRRLNTAHRVRDGAAAQPDRHDEYRFYQVLVATWPPDVPDAMAAAHTLRDRLIAHMLKAAREASRHTSWRQPDEGYETALSTFVSGALTDRPFVESLAAFANSIARVAVVNSLAQTVIKLASPGVPDLYQGTELWDLHLVDPDNRVRPDYTRAAAAISALDESVRADSSMSTVVSNVLDRWPDGTIKLLVTSRGLRTRREHHQLFTAGTYLPLETRTSVNSELIAFARTLERHVAVVVAPRLVAPLMENGGWPIGEAWQGAHVRLPSLCGGRRLTNVLTGESLQVATSEHPEVRVAHALSALPVALLLALD